MNIQTTINMNTTMNMKTTMNAEKFPWPRRPYTAQVYMPYRVCQATFGAV
jgi:hypothetical protein